MASYVLYEYEYSNNKFQKLKKQIIQYSYLIYYNHEKVISSLCTDCGVDEVAIDDVD